MTRQETSSCHPPNRGIILERSSILHKTSCLSTLLHWVSTARSQKENKFLTSQQHISHSVFIMSDYAKRSEVTIETMVGNFSPSANSHGRCPKIEPSAQGYARKWPTISFHRVYDSLSFCVSPIHLCLCLILHV